jgi:hypothetical protein
MSQIIMEFDDNGNVTIEGKGFTGKTCDKEMGDFEKSLGTVKNRKNKPEYYQLNTNKSKVTV